MATHPEAKRDWLQEGKEMIRDQMHTTHAFQSGLIKLEERKTPEGELMPFWETRAFSFAHPNEALQKILDESK